MSSEQTRDEVRARAERARKLANENVPTATIANMLGVSPQTVYRYLKNDLPKAPVNRKPHSQRIKLALPVELLYDLHASGTDIRVLAVRAGVSTRTLRRRFKEHEKAVYYNGLPY